MEFINVLENPQGLCLEKLIAVREIRGKKYAGIVGECGLWHPLTKRDGEIVYFFRNVKHTIEWPPLILAAQIAMDK